MMGGVLQDRDARGVNCVPDYEAVGKGHIGVWGGLRPNAVPSVKGGDSPLCRSFRETEPPPFHSLGLLCLNGVGVGFWGRVGSSGFDAAPEMQP